MFSENKNNDKVEKSQKCWEYLNSVSGKEICSEKARKNCSVSKMGFDNDCWFFSSSDCLEIIGVNHCWDCPWFKHKNPYFPRQFGR